ncbi:MAG TPA: chemotaxis protein CheX [Bryobacteraceae bacterium]|nr:chemotaxis protein CheX [Bryobacteraceae bacterium]
MERTTNTESAALSHAEMLEAIQAATHEVFSTMLNLDLTQGDPPSEKKPLKPGSGVVSLIGLAGSWVGSGSLILTSQFACKIASQLLMAEYQEIDDDVLDAVAEVTNMIMGNVKTVLEARLGAMGLSIPTIIYGENFQTRSAGNQDWTVVPFLLGDEKMCVQVCIAPNVSADKRTIRPLFPIPHLLHL